ncbi:MAG: bifunctional 4-hydroxy-2-oxoglutarate aldolase/2-dehydro-3-deoxy-phosphogluconate aldolase [Chloroflexota bacterium]
MNAIEKIAQSKIIAVIRLDDLTHAIPLSKALLEGGINILEFTLTNEKAPQAIASVRDALGDSVFVGAGSVVTTEQVIEVAQHGGEFVISPITKHDVIDTCHEYQLPTMPGAYTPSEVQSAWERDVAAVKVFPARSLGASYIKDVLAPLPHLRLIPTGGIGVKNIADFINAGVFAVGIGGALCNPETIARQDWTAISNSAEALREAIS